MKFPNLTVVDHPAVRHKLSYLRDKNTPSPLFRDLVQEITLLLFYEVLSGLPLKKKSVKTPLETCEAEELDREHLPVVIPILRAGLGMVEGALRLMPVLRVGMLGFSRDEETLKPTHYYQKLPAAPGKDVILLDPMLATGGTLVHAIDFLKKHGFTRFKLVVLMAAPEGVKKVHEHHPDVKIYAAALDRELSSKGYILPGLGDAGDRIFGT